MITCFIIMLAIFAHDLKNNLTEHLNYALKINYIYKYYKNASVAQLDRATDS